MTVPLYLLVIGCGLRPEGWDHGQGGSAAGGVPWEADLEGWLPIELPAAGAAPSCPRLSSPPNSVNICDPNQFQKLHWTERSSTLSLSQFTATK